MMFFRHERFAAVETLSYACEAFAPGAVAARWAAILRTMGHAGDSGTAPCTHVCGHLGGGSELVAGTIGAHLVFAQPSKVCNFAVAPARLP